MHPGKQSQPGKYCDADCGISDPISRWLSAGLTAWKFRMEIDRVGLSLATQHTSLSALRTVLYDYPSCSVVSDGACY